MRTRQLNSCAGRSRAAPLAPPFQRAPDSSAPPLAHRAARCCSARRGGLLSRRGRPLAEAYYPARRAALSLCTPPPRGSPAAAHSFLAPPKRLRLGVNMRRRPEKGTAPTCRFSSRNSHQRTAPSERPAASSEMPWRRRGTAMARHTAARSTRTAREARMRERMLQGAAAAGAGGVTGVAMDGVRARWSWKLEREVEALGGGAWEHFSEFSFCEEFLVTTARRTLFYTHPAPDPQPGRLRISAPSAPCILLPCRAALVTSLLSLLRTRRALPPFLLRPRSSPGRAARTAALRQLATAASARAAAPPLVGAQPPQ